MVEIVLQDNITANLTFRKFFANHLYTRGIDWYKDETNKFLWVITDKFNEVDLTYNTNTMLTIDPATLSKHGILEEWPAECEKFEQKMTDYIFREKVLSVFEFLTKWGDAVKAKKLDNSFLKKPYTIQGEVQSYRINDSGDEDAKYAVEISLVQYWHKHRYCLRVRFEQKPANIAELKRYSIIRIVGKPYIIGYLNHNKKYVNAYNDEIIISGESFTHIASAPLEIIKGNIAYRKLKNNPSCRKQTRNRDFKYPINNIILISGSKGNAAESDFKHILSEYVDKEIFTIKSLNIKFTDENITDTIKEINNNTDFKADSNNCICIVRGGGNLYDLLPFSHPDVLKAIHESDIPIVLGIGHSSDDRYLLCNAVADKACITPTEAAHFFIDLYEKHNAPKDNG